jgi:bifunctional DNA-binding transcriptional regulator/antitoxin component of YhaV-PrlF toxin-antitoxin module
VEREGLDSSKGQVTLPKSVRERLGVETGDRMGSDVIGLDMDVLVRYLTQDDPKQSRIATQFLETTAISAAARLIAECQR